MKKDRRTPHERKLMFYAEEVGFSVYDFTQIGNGFPDFVVAYDGVNVLVECKMSETSVLSGAQNEWHCNWNGVIHVWIDYECVRKTRDFCVNSLKSPGVLNGESKVVVPHWSDWQFTEEDMAWAEGDSWDV